jgi:hypothetical protein
MKKLVVLVVVALAASACSITTKGGARGPNIQRTSDDSAQKTDPATNGALDGQPELGQR